MATPDLAIAGRLLRANHSLYNLSEGAALGTEPYCQAVGFTTPPTLIEKRNIDAALVGRFGDGVLVAFRGTLLPGKTRILDRARDWGNDLKQMLARSDGLPGRVHTGLAESSTELWPDVREAVRTLMANGGPLYVTGHSKGALLACYNAYRLQEAGFPVAEVHTFGSPRVGDAAFVQGYSSKIARHWRYEAYDDIFVHVPARTSSFPTPGPLTQWLAARASYEQVGVLQYIDWDDQIRPDAPGLEARRLLHIAETIVTAKFERFYDNHYIPTGYEPRICGSRLAQA
jgi:hypothetical protein